MLTGLSVIEALTVLHCLKNQKLYTQSEYANPEKAYCISEGHICKTDGYDILDRTPTINVADILIGATPIT